VLLETLPPVQRLALAYAPVRARKPTLALLALDTRLAGIVRHSHEPSLAQLRLAWWREQLLADARTWPRGEPLLAALRSWQGHQNGLLALVDGWEYLTGVAPLPEADLAAFAEGRGLAFKSLAELLGIEPESAARLGRQWALADLAVHVAHPDEQSVARRLLAGEGRPARVGRALRPLTVLHGLAVRKQSAPSLLAALRLGLLGR
jgi:phytoene synthase